MHSFPQQLCVWLLIASAWLITTGTASAEYNANIKGVITELNVYSDGDFIYIRTDNQPAHAVCSNNYFVIDGSLPAERLNRMLSRLMLAYAQGERINIGYDAEGDCATGYIRVHRVG